MRCSYQRRYSGRGLCPYILELQSFELVTEAVLIVEVVAVGGVEGVEAATTTAAVEVAVVVIVAMVVVIVVVVEVVIVVVIIITDLFVVNVVIRYHLQQY